jgi:hypothetical protein
MKFNTATVLLLIGLTVVFAACQKPEPPPPPPPTEPPPPPEPTPEQHHGQLMSVLGTLAFPGTLAPPDDVIQGIIDQVQSRRMQLAMSENGQAAIQMASRDVDEAIRIAKEEEKWKKVKALCMIYSALQPGNERYATLQEDATIMMNKPKITVTGFVELDGELYAFMDLFDPKTGETTQYRRREGEEFHDVMRIVRIVGNQQSVEVEYLPARYIWTLPGPRERSRGTAAL